MDDGFGVCPWVHAGLVTFQGFDEGPANAVACRAVGRRDASNKVEPSGKISGLSEGADAAFSSQPLDGSRGAESG